MIRSLYFKLLLSAMLSIALLMVGLVSLEYEYLLNEQYRQVQQDMHNDMSRLFSTSSAQQEQLSKQQGIQALTLDWPDRRVDGIMCDGIGKELWKDLRQTDLRSQKNLCGRLMPLINPDESQFRLVRFNSQSPYYLYSMRVTRYTQPDHPQTMHIILLRSASSLLAENHHYLYQILQRDSLIYLCVVLILIISTRWALTPLRRMKTELDNIRHGLQESLSDDYDKELKPLTQSLNQLLDNERQQKQRYQHSMNDLAHSLKTRLSLIQATMQEEHLSDRLQRGLTDQVILIDQIIQYHLRRAVAGRQLLNSQGCDPVPVVQKLLATMAKVYQHKRLSIRLKLDDNLLFIGEQDDLFELLGNLLDNAHKFALSEIHLRLSHINDQLLIQLDDDGPGVPESQRERILQRGVRADNSSGQGIGLAVCSEIVHSYNGQIHISDSTLGGACFRLELPGQKLPT